MQKFMKMLNNISRSQAIYRQSKIPAKDLQSGHYAFALTICGKPGRSQEEIARELCINKSTVTRNLNYLEEKGYVKRNALPHDKRQFAVYPTEKMLEVIDEIRSASEEWMSLLSKDIPDEDLEIFNSVLAIMEKRAGMIIERQEK